MVITGYRMDTTDINEIMRNLDKIKKKLQIKMNKKYNELLGEEIAFICDNIALGMMKRNPGVSIIDEAAKNLEHKIHNAKIMGAENKYNFTLYAHVMSYENDTYIKLTCPNKEYIATFNKLEVFSLDEVECQDKVNQKMIIWNKLHEIYSKSTPFVIDFACPLAFDKEKLVYPTKKERAETRARHSLTNHYLNIISAGQQIPPILLMPYMDIAMEMFELPSAKVEYRSKVTNLMQILPDIDEDDSFIYKKIDNVEIGVDEVG